MSKSSLNDPLNIVRNYDEVGVAFAAFGLSLAQLAEAADAYAKYIKVNSYQSIADDPRAEPIWAQQLNDAAETLIAIHPNGVLQARRKSWAEAQDRELFENYCFTLVELAPSEEASVG